MQWARRSALAGSSEAAVNQEFTRLTDDLMQPIGQILSIQANSTESARQLLRGEPFHLLDVVEEWRIYRMESSLSMNFTNSIIEPRVFIGFFEPHVAENKDLLDASEVS